jgi:hypothetical protein
MAYERALELLPSAHTELQNEAYESLRNLLLTGRDQLTSGYMPGRDTARFLARLAWISDTLALIPYPWTRITGGGAAVYPPGFEQALAQQRAAFHRIASAWSVALPRSAGAKEALAISLEMLGDPGAADTLRAARRLAADPLRRSQLAAVEALVRVKFAVPDGMADLRIARAIADSMLAADSAAVPVMDELPGAMAELVGRCERAVALRRTASVAQTSPLSIPQQYTADAVELLLRAVMGCMSPNSGMSITRLAERLNDDPRFARPESRHVAEDILLFRLAQLVLPPDRETIARLAASRPNSILGAMQALAVGDTVAARRTLLTTIQAHGRLAPSIDAAYPEVRLLLALGDSVEALGLLRRALDAVRTAEPRSFAAAGWAGTLARAMALRAELEDAAGDRRAARAWANAVVALWGGADPSVQPVVRQMQRYQRP